MTIEQTIEIPADRRITMEVPPEIPSGAIARLELSWSPQNELSNNLDAVLEIIWALCKDSPITVESFLEMRRQDKELEEDQFRQFFSGAGGCN